jgi:hypothetical protein
VLLSVRTVPGRNRPPVARLLRHAPLPTPEVGRVAWFRSTRVPGSGTCMVLVAPDVMLS